MTVLRPARPADPAQVASHTIVLGRVAAALALGSLAVGGVLMALTVPLLASVPQADAGRVIRDNGALFWWAAVALLLISAFDLFTIPALHERLHAGHPRLILVATITAAAGDLLGILGRTIQASEVTAATSSPSSVPVLVILEQAVNTAGFVLVSVAFTGFGLAMVRGNARWLGVVGMLAGLTTALGQLPGFELVFTAANLAFVAWYVGLAIRLRPPR